MNFPWDMMAMWGSGFLMGLSVQYWVEGRWPQFWAECHQHGRKA